MKLLLKLFFVKFQFDVSFEKSGVGYPVLRGLGLHLHHLQTDLSGMICILDTGCLCSDAFHYVSCLYLNVLGDELLI